MDAMLDLSKLSEDQRIKAIGNFVMESRKSTWCITDDEPDKPERYKRKMKKQFPFLVLGEIKHRFPGKGAAGFTVYPPVQN